MEDFKDKNSYIATEKDQSKSLWGEEEKTFLDEVTVNLVPDDDEALGLKGKTAMKWDSKKKRYMLKQVDREGRVMKEKRNESGAKVSRGKD
mmetsp:Transcript_45895/g.33656  ORF Transcript_45895/g.33656 Transcript_45895/m.33656 type:complete len:91 (-) Transcript_45895:363-635(-)